MPITQKHSPQLRLLVGFPTSLIKNLRCFFWMRRYTGCFFEDAFKPHYSEKMGKPAKPIRLKVSLLILKYLRNLSQEYLMEQWSENIYYRHFSGVQHFQPNIPCVATELVMFRQRISEAGV